MAEKIPIPDGTRWRIAAKVASLLPVTYGRVFREIVSPEPYDRLEQQIWVALAHEASIVARTHSLPVANARDLSSTLDILNTVFFGPETKSEQVVFDNDRAVLLVWKCPFMLWQRDLYGPPINLFNRCLAFSIAATEALNPDYTLRFVRAACHGDRHCEMKILTKRSAEAAEKE